MDHKISRQWSLETHSANHKGLQASLMALCPNGALAILAGKKGMALVDIEAPESVVARASNLHSKHSDPSCLQWSRDGSAVACAQQAKVRLLSGEVIWVRTMGPNLLVLCRIN